MDFAASDFALAIELASTGFAVFAIGLLVAELVWLWRGERFTRARFVEMLASYSVLVPVLIVDALAAGSVIALYLLAAAAVPWSIPVTWWSVVLALVLTDFAYYWEHWLEHRIRFLWALSHNVHHSSPDFNQATAYRVSFVDQFVSPLFYLPLVGLGFHPLLVLTSLVFILSYQSWIHTEMIGRFGWFERIFNTPSNHRVHHGTQAKYLDRNFGAVLILWDRIFGTYQAEEETPDYGLIEQLNSVNPLRVHFQDLFALLADLRAAPSIGAAAGFLFRPPGWRPSVLYSPARAFPRKR